MLPVNSPPATTTALSFPFPSFSLKSSSPKCKSSAKSKEKALYYSGWPYKTRFSIGIDEIIQLISVVRMLNNTIGKLTNLKCNSIDLP